MNNWILILPMAAFAILAAAGWIMAWSYLRHFVQVGILYAAACEERKLLFAQNADLREEVQERRAECISLKLQLEEALHAQPKARPVRVKRAETQDE